MIGDITMTSRAVQKIRQLLAGRDQRNGLRVRIVSGRCSAFEYETIIDAPMEEDEIFSKSGARILVDPGSFLHLNGMQLDYKDELMPAPFVFNNPKAKRTCGCGSSFEREHSGS